MKPFHELKIVEIAGSQAGAFAAKFFADYGARVVKVEPPGGDPLRANGERWGNLGSEFAYLNTSKRSVALDLEGETGRREMEPLLDVADVVIESSAPDPLEPITAGLGSDQLIRTEISPFGSSGPYARLRSNVFTDDAVGGHMYLSGDPDREPLRRAGLHTHFQAGTHAFIGSMAALLARERVGRGQRVEVSHFEGMAALHQHTTVMWTHGRFIVRREGNAQPGGPWHPAGVYPCKDGHVFLGHAGSKHLTPFLQVLGCQHLVDDPVFGNDGARGAHKREFDQALTKRLMELTADEITEFGRTVFSPIGPVPTMLEVLEDEQYEARDFWCELPGEPPLKIPRGPFAIEGHEPHPAPPPRNPGADGLEELLASWRPDASTGAPATASESLSDGPLQGIRILDMTRVWAGPIGGRLLADLGADTISIESPWNRGFRDVDPAHAALTHLYPDNEPGERPWNRNSGFNKLARNKRSVTLDLGQDRARDLLAELVKQADVVLENYSPRVMPQLGFDFESLKRLNPSIVYTSMPGYGSTGPGRNRTALGPVIEAAVGLTSIMGYADSGPYRSGVAWADPVSGMAAAAGTLVALWNREANDGAAQRVETAMSESMASFAGEELLAAQVRGSDAARIGNRHPEHAPQGVYPCAGDDRWLAISVERDGEWEALVEVAGLDPSMAALTVEERRDRHDEIDAAVAAWTRSQSPAFAARQLQDRGVIALPLSDARDLVEDVQLEARGFWAEHDHADAGRRRYPGNPIKLSETPVTFRRPPPRLGEHNEEILGGLLAISADELSALHAAGVIAEEPPPRTEA